MIVIIEGADKTGKTTLAKKLAADLGWRYEHFGAPAKGSRAADQYLNYLKNLKRPTIIDRFHIGETIYGKLLRGESQVNDQEMTVLNRWINKLNGMVVLMEPQLKEFEDRWAVGKRHEDIDNSQAVSVFKMFSDKYTELIDQLEFKVMEDSETEYDVLKKIVKNKLNDYYRAKRYKLTGYGSLQPSYIFVGDSLNENVTWSGMPFDGGKSSALLANSLFKANVLEKYCYFVNSDTLTPQEMRWLTKHELGIVVALGNNASKKLTILGYNHDKIPHPSYWLRFMSKNIQGKTYDKIIEEVVKC